MRYITVGYFKLVVECKSRLFRRNNHKKDDLLVLVTQAAVPKVLIL